MEDFGQQQTQEKTIEITAPIISYLKNELPMFTERKLSQPCVIEDEEFSKFQQHLNISSNGGMEGFLAVISLHDANTLYVSSGITASLGYPQDMLVGQSIMGFLYPKDRLTFANLLSRGLQSRFNHASETAIDSDGRFVFYVRIREYKGLKNCGFEIAGKQASCKPFQLRCFIRDVASAEQISVPENPTQGPHADLLTMCFVIVAIPIYSAHKLSEEQNPAMVPFSTRHTSSCHFSFVDHSSISFLGYFPQDIIGFSIFNFYHPEDLVILKEAYILVSNEASHSIRGRPVRFRVFNGDYIVLETEWSSFVNPWTRKIEFIIGNHRILQGPVNVNVFDDVSNKILHNREVTVSPASKLVQSEIIEFLSKAVSRIVLNQITSESSGIKRKRKLAAQVNEIIDLGGRTLSGKEWSDKYSCVLGAVSPHLESHSDSSSDTPPPFQEERLKDNIERFFASQPQTNCETCSSSSSGSSSQNNETSPDRTHSNDGSGSGSSDPKQCHSSIDSAFQSGSNEGSGNGNGNKNIGLQSHHRQMTEEDDGYTHGIGGGNSKNNENMMPTEEDIDRTHLETLKNFRKLTEEALTFHDRHVRYKNHSKMARNMPSASGNQMDSQGNCNQRECGNQRRQAQEGSRMSAKKHTRGSDHEPGKRGVHQWVQEGGHSAANIFPSPPYSMVLPMTWLPQPAPQNLCSSCSRNFRQEQQSGQIMLPVLCALPLSLSPASSSSNPSSSRNGFSSSTNNEHRNPHHDPLTTQEEFLAQRRNARIRTDFASVCRQLFPSGDDERKNESGEKSKKVGDAEDGDRRHSFPGEGNSTGLSTSSSSLLLTSSESPIRYTEFLEEDKPNEHAKAEFRRRMRNVFEPPAWIKNVNYTDNLIYRYKIDPDSSETLIDETKNHEDQQPLLVKQQLELLSNHSDSFGESIVEQYQNIELPDGEN